MTRRIERFCKTTRWFHWTFVLPFLGLAGTGGALLCREALSLSESTTQTVVRSHEALAIVWLVAPALVLLSGQTAATLGDLAEALRWDRDDLRWLALQPAALLGRAELPAAGKLNAGQKANALATAGLATGLLLSGVWSWLRPGAIAPWIAHLSLFAAWLPAFAGHFYLAVLNPGTRPALRAMFAGWVELDWARHHHARWMRTELEAPRILVPAQGGSGSAGARPVFEDEQA
jgi:formate dehydrogenase subunit gamma